MAAPNRVVYNFCSVRSSGRFFACLQELLDLRRSGRSSQRTARPSTSAAFTRDYWALRDVTFEVQRGETFCIVGENGCGKSTLLQICAGILAAHIAGPLRVNGRVSALLELGAGFNPEFSGRDNVYLNGAILGLLQLKKWIGDSRTLRTSPRSATSSDQPVKTYSSGMVVRLAFAVAIHVDPEILLVDEALAVGDVYFRQRCMRKVHELRPAALRSCSFPTPPATSKLWAIARSGWITGRSMASERPILLYLNTLLRWRQRIASIARMKRPSHPGRFPMLPLEVVEAIPNIDHRFGDGRARSPGHRRLTTPDGAAAVLASTHLNHRRTNQRPGESEYGSSHCRLHVPQPPGRRFRRDQYGREGYDFPP